MRILFLDCPSGISGDMTVGSLCDLGVKPSTLEWELAKLDIGDFHMHFERKQRKNVEGIKFTIHEGAVHTHDQDEHEHEHECCGHHHEHEEDEHHDAHGEHSHSHGEEHEHHDCGGHHHHEHEHGHEHHAHEQAHGEHDHDCCSHEHHHHGDHEHEYEHSRTHRQIRELIEASDLSPFVKKHALSIFQRIAVAEGKIHGQSPDDVHFHEVGALDSIADIVCACAGIEALGVEKIYVSALHEGHGFIDCAHGRFPVPAPATLEILRGIPLGQIDEPNELITPTGAAILAEFGTSFGLMPRMKVERIGYGVGTRELNSGPNVLRAVLGDLVED